MRGWVALLPLFCIFLIPTLAQQSVPSEQQESAEVYKAPAYELQDILNYGTTPYGVFAWHNKEYVKQIGVQQVPEYQINQITYHPGIGFVARCVYRRDKGRYADETASAPDKEVYSVRLVNLKWLTSARSPMGVVGVDDKKTDEKSNDSDVTRSETKATTNVQK